MGHADSVGFVQDVIGKEILLIEPEMTRKGIGSRRTIAFCQKFIQGMGQRARHQSTFFVLRECTVPKYVGAGGLHCGAFKKTLHFVFQADLFVGNRPVLDRRVGQPK